MIFDFMKTREGTIVVSIILGFGLAAMFRQVCSKGNCVIIKGPNPAEVEQNIYRIRDECYKYTPHITPCSNDVVEQKSDGIVPTQGRR
jgi:hypothetical protein